MYVDFDYECLESFDSHITDDECHFAMEPEFHSRSMGKDLCFNNALMIAPPCHPFFETILAHLQTVPITNTGNKFLDVLKTTGPLMLIDLYEKLENKSGIRLLPAELVSPWTKSEVLDYLDGNTNSKMLEAKLENAIAIHYFWGSWTR